MEEERGRKGERERREWGDERMEGDRPGPFTPLSSPISYGSKVEGGREGGSRRGRRWRGRGREQRGEGENNGTGTESVGGWH